MTQIYLAWDGSIGDPTMMAFLDPEQAKAFSKTTKRPVEILETQFNDIPGQDDVAKDGAATPGRRKIFVYILFGRVIECSNSRDEVRRAAAGSQGKGDVFTVDLIETAAASEAIDGAADYLGPRG